MAVFSPLIDDMINALQCLPGVGSKTAQRMALHLLERNRHSARILAKSLAAAMEGVTTCSQCRNLCEAALCSFCQDKSRDCSMLCVVETPADLLSIEQAGSFRGRYFVLAGHLSPIKGIGPEELGISQLLTQLSSGETKEVILATNPTIEGEATAFFLIDQIKAMNIRVSRIAHGVPVGGELEYVDSSTLSYALEGRRSC